MSELARHPQLIPADHCYTILMDYGENDGGWGPALVSIKGLPRTAFVYTGASADVLEAAEAACRDLAQATGRPTRLVRFTGREDVAAFGGSS